MERALRPAGAAGGGGGALECRDSPLPAAFGAAAAAAAARGGGAGRRGGPAPGLPGQKMANCLPGAARAAQPVTAVGTAAEGCAAPGGGGVEGAGAFAGAVGAEEWGRGNEAVLRNLTRAEERRRGRGGAAQSLEAGRALCSDEDSMDRRRLAFDTARACSQKLELAEPTFHLAAAFFDSVILRSASGRLNISTMEGLAIHSQFGSLMTALACLFIASKVEEVRSPSAAYFLHHCALTSSEICPRKARLRLELNLDPELPARFLALETHVLVALDWVTTPVTALHFFGRLSAAWPHVQVGRLNQSPAPRPAAEASGPAAALLVQAARSPKVALLYRPSTVALAVLAAVERWKIPDFSALSARDIGGLCDQIESFREEAHVDPSWLFGWQQRHPQDEAEEASKERSPSVVSELPALEGCARARGIYLGGLI